LTGKSGATKLTNIIKQSALNINYGLNNFNKHRLFEVNPSVKKKVSYNESKQIQKCHFTNSIGLSVKHFNLAEDKREEQRCIQRLNKDKQSERTIEEGLNQPR
jgi:hypothetical protein